MDRFGRKQAQSLPCWSNGGVVRAEPEAVYVSLYQHPRSGVLAVIDNYSTRPVEATGALQTARLGLPATATASDGLTAEAVSLEGGKVQLGLQALGWKVVWVR